MLVIMIVVTVESVLANRFYRESGAPAALKHGGLTFGRPRSRASAGMSVSFDPVGNWFVVAAFAVVVTGLTLWAYSPGCRTRRASGAGSRSGLRLAAVLLCLIAALAALGRLPGEEEAAGDA